MKDYLRYESPTAADIQTIAKTCSMNHLYDFICIEGLQDDVWDEWEDLDNVGKVQLFLEIQKYPSIAMKKLDEYISKNGWIVDMLMKSYDEYLSMGDPSKEDVREQFVNLVSEENWPFLKEGIETVISEYEMDINKMPETKAVMNLLDILIRFNRCMNELLAAEELHKLHVEGII